MAEPFVMPFGMYTNVGPRNHVSDGSSVQISMGNGSFGEGHVLAYCQVK